MHTSVSGKAYVVGDDVDTDQIIPAEYLSYNPAIAEERKYFGIYALSGVPIEQAGLPDGNTPFMADGEVSSEFSVIIAGRNFGCGSSREHAPLAISAAGVGVVVAESYARIFYRNSINGGYLMPLETSDRLIDQISTGDEVEVDLSKLTLTNHTIGKTFGLKGLGDAAEIAQAGGIFEYARKTGMLK
ncbi:MAG: 3-isopropylmalate dehydratase [Planctomycetes bacterium]|nr:3-isopropylmalate dehydratase [Planctomycetota bacterium]